MPPCAAPDDACLDKPVTCCQQFTVHRERSTGRGKKNHKRNKQKTFAKGLWRDSGFT